MAADSQSAPDNSDAPEFAGTMPVPDRHQVDVQRLTDWLTAHLPGFRGPLRIQIFKGGQSNPTYLLSAASGNYVMRAKPGPVAKLLPSAHAIEREYRVLSALATTDVPVAKVFCLCEDEDVIGRAFYLMEHVSGRVLWEQSLPGMSTAERAAIYDEMNRVMAALHSVNPAAIGLSDFGRPGNYFARQITRWTKQYQASETEPIESMHRLIEWLPAHLPQSEETSIVHGDFRLDNLIFDPTSARVLAVLDWELSTLGHPLADFSYHCMSWRIPPGTFRGIGGLDLNALGIPAERQYISLYCQRTGRNVADVLEHWDFYLAYNMFRLAAILQGIVKRVADGTASNTQAPATIERVRPLAEMGWAIARGIA